MCEKQKSLEVLVTSMRHEMKIKNTCIDAELFYYLGLEVRVSFKLHFAEVSRDSSCYPDLDSSCYRTGHKCPSVPAWRLDLCEMVGHFHKLSGEDHSKSWLLSLMPGLLAGNPEFTAPKLRDLSPETTRKQRLMQVRIMWFKWFFCAC